MLTHKILNKLLQHRGPIWHVKEVHVPGNDLVCPRCQGSGEHETTKFDYYESWTEPVTCSTCNGRGRAQKVFIIEESNYWHLKATSTGIELSHGLKDRVIFFSQAEAQAEADKLTQEERAKQSGKTQS